MNYLTDRLGKDITQWNPLSVNDVSTSYDKVPVTGETVTFQTGAAGFSQSVSVDKAPIMNLIGDRVGSFWRLPQNLRCSNSYRMSSAKVTALVETNGSATVTITDPDFNLEQLFESPAATGKFVIVVRDNAGGELTGYIQAIAATGDSYVLDINNDAALGTQNWVGTLADFTLSVGSTQYEIYSNETSIAWTTGTVLLTEVNFPEGAVNGANGLTQFLAGLSDGEYGVDYDHGNIHYKKATTGTSDTLAYTTRAATAVSVAPGGGSSLQNDDAVYVTGQPVTMIGLEVDAPTSLAAKTEGDVSNFKGDLAARLIATLGTQSAGEDLANDVLKTEEQFGYQAIVAADTQVLSGEGLLKSATFSCNDAAPTAGSIIIYDSLTEANAQLFNHTFTTTPFVPFTVTFDAVVGVGIYIGFTTTADVNVELSYR